MKLSFQLLTLAAIIWMACKNNSTEPSSAVVLNNGQKWTANAETTEGIKNMISLLETLPIDAPLEEYHSAHAKLEAEFQMIFRKCTMKGEAHDQLHNYLLPLKERIDKLDSSSLSDCKLAADELKIYLKAYDKYFQ